MLPGSKWPWALSSSIALVIGCSPADYREDADSEVHGILQEKSGDPRWAIPSVSIVPSEESRLFDPFDPDRPPLPPDDPVAHGYMLNPNGMAGYEGWHDQGEALSVEAPGWRKYLALSEEGRLELSPKRSFDLALLHSREYQSELEELYQTALSLSLERYEFNTRFFGTNRTEAQHIGEDSPTGESNSVSTLTDIGFTRALGAGGQFLVDLANSFVVEFSGSNSTVVSSNLAMAFVQPILRGAGREVRLEALTQAERDVLYAVRDFARFRKQFYFSVVAGDEGFLLLLLQLQGIRNLEANLESLSRNLEEHEALAEAGIVSKIQVDQVFQSYQAGRLALTEARNAFESSLDVYKTRLGLPPVLPLHLDDSTLAPFQLNDPRLGELEKEVERLLASFRELDEAPDLAMLRQGFDGLSGFQRRLGELASNVAVEMDRWMSQPPEEGAATREDAVMEEEAQDQLSGRLAEVMEDIQTLGRNLGEAVTALEGQDRTPAWESLQRFARQELGMVSDLFVIQAQVRAHLIRLEPVDHEEEGALKAALAERLDLMNERARVVDAWRKIKVAADGLEGGLDLFLAADIPTKPGSDNPVNFSAAAGRYRAGFLIDGPLDRKEERNRYRAQLIEYQKARRSYMAIEDEITRAVRQDVRQLEADRLNFEIARQSLIAAARQVEQSRDQLTAPGPAGDSSSTQDVLDALQSLLNAKNALIGTWVAYETNRMRLLLDIETLDLEEEGISRK